MTARVLLVDSAFPKTASIERSLLKASFDVAVATTAYDALLLCCKGQTDVVLLDAAQPDLDALELCRTLKRDPILRHLPVVAMSDKARPGLRLQAFDAGADESLIHPASDGELELRLRSAAAFKSLCDDHRLLVTLGDLPDEAPSGEDGLLKVLLIDSNERSSGRIEEILAAECEVVTVAEEEWGASCSLLGDFDVVIRERRGQAGTTGFPATSDRSARTLLLLDEDMPVPAGSEAWTIDDVLFRPVDRCEVLGRVRLMGRKQRLLRRILGLEAGLSAEGQGPDPSPPEVEVTVSRSDPEPVRRPGTYLRSAA